MGGTRSGSLPPLLVPSPGSPPGMPENQNHKKYYDISKMYYRAICLKCDFGKSLYILALNKQTSNFFNNSIE